MLQAAYPTLAVRPLTASEHPAPAPNASTTTAKWKNNFRHHDETNNKIIFTKQQKLQNMPRKQHQKQQERSKR
jgi:hypothetical protein